jgi:hypothetical protein
MIMQLKVIINRNKLDALYVFRNKKRNLKTSEIMIGNSSK